MLKKRLLPLFILLVLAISLFSLIRGYNLRPDLSSQNILKHLSDNSTLKQIREEIGKNFEAFGGKDIPDIPPPPGSSRTFFIETVDTEKGIKAASVLYQVGQDIQKVDKFYVLEMRTKGWVLQGVEKTGIPDSSDRALSFSKEGARCRITLMGQEGVKATIVQISLAGKYQTVSSTQPFTEYLKKLLKAFLALPPWMRWSTILGLIFLAYFILGSRFLYSKIALLKWGLLYSILTTLFVSAYLFVLRVAQAIFQYIPPLVTILFLIFVVILFLPLRNALQKLIDELFFKRERRYRTFLQEFSQSLNSLLTLPELSTKIVDAVRKSTNLRYAFLLLYDSQSDSFSLLAASGELKDVSQQAIFNKEGNEYYCYASNKGSPKIIWKSKDKEGVIRDKIFKSLLVRQYPEGEKEQREFLDSIPLYCKGKLIGILNLGRKLSRGAFSGEDLSLLATLASQTAIALENARLYQETINKEQTLNRLMQAVQRAHEEERRRISQDLHDSVAQNLSSIILNLDFLRKQIPARNNQARQEIERLEELTKETISELRKLIYDLRPTTLDSLGLVLTLQKHVEQFSKENQIKIKFNSLLEERLPAPVETTLFRLTQEALNNVKKHAGANQVAISLERVQDAVNVTIEDNGKGFDLRRMKSPRFRDEGLGLLGMRERTESLGGNLNIITQPGRGTKIIATIPTQLKEDVQWMR